MDLSKKTTILFSEDLHRRLSELAEKEGISLGELVRRACARQYGVVGIEERVEAVKALAGLRLPVSDVQTMARESTTAPEGLLP